MASQSGASTRSLGEEEPPSDSYITDSGIFTSANLAIHPPIDYRPRVGVVGVQSFQWLWIAECLGFQVRWCWGADVTTLPQWAKKPYPSLALTTRRQLLTPVEIILCEGKVPRWLGDWTLTSTIISLRPPSFKTAWRRCLSYQHSDLGGLTTKRSTIWISRPYAPAVWSPPEPEFVLKTAVYSVASDTVPVGRPCKPPPSRLLSDIRVMSMGGNVYHGGGLFPIGARSPRFVLPSVHSRTRWVRRSLTAEELLMVYDVPYNIFAATGSAELIGQVHPGRCLQAGLRNMMRGMNWMERGGTFLFPNILEDTRTTPRPERTMDYLPFEPTTTVNSATSCQAGAMDGRETCVDTQEARVPSEVDDSDLEPITTVNSATSCQAGSMDELATCVGTQEARVHSEADDSETDSQSVITTESMDAAIERDLSRNWATSISRYGPDGWVRERKRLVKRAKKRLLKKLRRHSDEDEQVGKGRRRSRVYEGQDDCSRQGNTKMEMPRKRHKYDAKLELIELETGIQRMAVEESDEVSDDEVDTVDVKATKSDDAEIDTARWRRNLGIELGRELGAEAESALMKIREFVLRWIRRRTTQMFLAWLHTKRKFQRSGIGMSHFVERASIVDPQVQTEEYAWTETGRGLYVEWWRSRWRRLEKDLVAGRESIRRFVNGSWWEWTEGSRPAHWKWPEWYQEIIRDGLPIWFREAPKAWTRPQNAPKNAVELEKVRKKLSKIRERGYVVTGEVTSLMSFFAVPKGEDDIRMVYDGTKSGLNDAIWVPRFRLPTVQNLLRAVDFKTVMSDFDIGEMFLNFVLHETMQALCGIDLSRFFGDGKVLWERWTRAAMGLKSSPYQAVQAVLVAKEVILGDRLEKSNAFRWDKVRLNLPGSAEYDPALPWVSKIRLDDGEIACDLFIYVDDGRVTAPNHRESARATRQAAATLNSLGIQEAARKRRWGSRRAGAWAGSIVQTSKDEVLVMVDDEKWQKTKRYIGDILYEMKTSRDGSLDFKELERKRGFLIYVTRTYPCMVPYLKGIHLTLDGWRKFRDEDGWKLSPQRVRELEKSMKIQVHHASTDDHPPKRVTPVKRLRSDLEALAVLTRPDKPPRRRVRSKKVLTVCYGFGDASAIGGSSNFQRVRKVGDNWRPEQHVNYMYGHWCTEVGEASSNYRELLNLIEGLELQVREGLLDGAEVFLFTDNTTAEAVFYKGNSSSVKLFELMLRLRRLEMAGNLILHVVHVSGKRMIVEGADGGSRGDLNQGAMAGHSVLEYVPLHLSALEAQPELEGWIRSWWDRSYGDLVTLEPEGWFTKGHQGGNYLWAPPPAAADVVVEQLSEAIHKRPWSTHVVVVPRIMTGRWRGDMIKETHFWTEFPASSSFWKEERYEPLTLFIYFPLIDRYPWSLRRTPLLEELGGELRQMRDSGQERSGCFLRELLLRARRLRGMQKGVVRKMLYHPSWKSFSRKAGIR